jgi:hypothetical protein
VCDQRSPARHRSLAAPTALTEDFADLNAYYSYASPRKGHAHLTGGSMTATRKRIAILVGINEYTGGIPPLRNAVHDIEVIGQILEGRFGFKVVRYCDKKASKAKLTAQADELSRTLTEEDSVLFYFAGHGIARSMLVAMDKDRSLKEKPFDGDFHLVPQDARLGDESSYWSSRELLKAVRSWPCRQSLLILDCCYAGQAALDARRSLHVQLGGPLSQETFAWYEAGKASQLLASAAHDQEAADSDALSLKQAAQARTEGGGEHSPFAQALIDGLRGKAGSRPDEDDNDGIILATDLYRYIYLRLSKQPSKHPHFTQTPDLVRLDPKNKNREFYFQDNSRSFPGLESIKKLSKENPYRGFASYQLDHERQYFGRNDAIEALERRISYEITQKPKDTNCNITIITGPSGTGKSSLLFAGLVPRLLDANCRVFALRRRTRGPTRIKVRPLSRKASSATSSPSSSSTTPAASATSLPPEASPRSHPSAQSASQATAGLPPAPLAAQPSHRSAPVSTQWLDLDEIDKELQDNSGQLLVFVVDQMEEVLDNPPQVSIATSFWREITNLCEKDRSRVRFIATLRSDYETYFSSIHRNCFHRMKSMSRQNLAEVIAGPAKQNGIFLAEDLLEDLVETYYDTPNSLPLLSFSLERIYENFRDNLGEKEATSSDKPEISKTIYNELQGEGVGGIFSNYADRVLRELQANISNKCSADLFDRLTKGLLWRFISSDKKTRRRVDAQELVYSEDTGVAQAIVDYLADKRLVVADSDDDSGQRYYQLTHDYLVTGWPWLAELSKAKNWETRHRVIRDVVHADFADTWKGSSKLDDALKNIDQGSICFNERERKCLESAKVAREAEREAAIEAARSTKEIKEVTERAAEAEKRAEVKAAKDRLRINAIGTGLLVTLVSLGLIVAVGRVIVRQAQQDLSKAEYRTNIQENKAHEAEHKATIALVRANEANVQAAEALLKAKEAENRQRTAEEKAEEYNKIAKRSDEANAETTKKLDIDMAINDMYQAYLNSNSVTRLLRYAKSQSDVYRKNYVSANLCNGKLENIAAKTATHSYSNQYAKCLHGKDAEEARVVKLRFGQIVELGRKDAYVFLAGKQFCLPINKPGNVLEAFEANNPGYFYAKKENEFQKCNVNWPEITEYKDIQKMDITKRLESTFRKSKDASDRFICSFGYCLIDKAANSASEKTIAGHRKALEKDLSSPKAITGKVISHNGTNFYYLRSKLGSSEIVKWSSVKNEEVIVSGVDVNEFAVSKNERIIVAAKKDQIIKSTRFNGREIEVAVLEIARDTSDISALTLNEDGSLLFVGFKNGTSLLFDAAQKLKILAYPALKDKSTGNGIPIQDVAIGPEIDKERKLLQVYENVVVVRTISRR